MKIDDINLEINKPDLYVLFYSKADKLVVTYNGELFGYSSGRILKQKDIFKSDPDTLDITSHLDIFFNSSAHNYEFFIIDTIGASYQTISKIIEYLYIRKDNLGVKIILLISSDTKVYYDTQLARVTSDTISSIDDWLVSHGKISTFPTWRYSE